MTPREHIQRLRDALKGLDEHSQGNAAIWAAAHDLGLDLHELEKAFNDQKLMEK